MSLQSSTVNRGRTARRSGSPASARGRKTETVDTGRSTRRLWIRFLPLWLILALVLSIVLPNILSTVFGATGRLVASVPHTVGGVFGAPSRGIIAPLFTAEVDHWDDEIQRWAAQYDLDPNLMATIMQIESCGHDTVTSVSGAQGLFQVMPFNFDPGAIYTDPDTNAMTSARVLNICLNMANGDPNFAMACYNGGPSVLKKSFDRWPSETQRYYVWGAGIYSDAVNNQTHSPTLDTWLAAGGAGLCEKARVERQQG